VQVIRAAQLFEIEWCDIVNCLMDSLIEQVAQSPVISHLCAELLLLTAHFLKIMTNTDDHLRDAFGQLADVDAPFQGVVHGSLAIAFETENHASFPKSQHARAKTAQKSTISFSLYDK
jgi:hypothetical protein